MGRDRGCRRLAGLVLAIAGELAVAAPASADELQEALTAYEEARLDEALRSFEALLERGGHDRETLATVTLHLGILHSGARATAQAREAFLLLLAARPDARLPEGLGTAVEEIFAEARREAGAEPLRPVLAVRGRSVRAGATGGAARLVATTRVRAAGAAPVLTFRGPGPHEGRLPPVDPGTELRLELLDAHGWALAEARAASPAAPVAPPQQNDERGTPLVGRWWLWAGVAAVVAGGVALALVASSQPGDPEVGAPTVVGGR